MNRIDTVFATAKRDGRTALIPYVTAGDPSLAVTATLLDALVGAGADVLELGVPFSDPMADGPTIQRSSERALAKGAGLSYVIECVSTICPFASWSRYVRLPCSTPGRPAQSDAA